MKSKGIAASPGDDGYTSKNPFDDLSKFGFNVITLNKVSVLLANYKTALVY